MIRHFAIVLAALFLLLSPVYATPPAQALYGTSTTGKTMGIYASDSALGLCLQGEAQMTPSSWVPIFTLQCGIQQSTLDAHGGAAGFIEWMRPDMNRAISAFFNGGGDVAGALDEAFNVSFKIDGGQLVPK